MKKVLFAAALAALVATEASAITPAPLPQQDTLTQVRYGCGPGRTRVGGVCVARTTIRHYRRMNRRMNRRAEIERYRP